MLYCSIANYYYLTVEPECKISHPAAPSNLSWVKLLSYLETLKRDQQTQAFSGETFVNNSFFLGDKHLLDTVHTFPLFLMFYFSPQAFVR